VFAFGMLLHLVWVVNFDEFFAGKLPIHVQPRGISDALKIALHFAPQSFQIAIEPGVTGQHVETPLWLCQSWLCLNQALLIIGKQGYFACNIRLFAPHDTSLCARETSGARASSPFHYIGLLFLTTLIDNTKSPSSRLLAPSASGDLSR
jgi:hypothetical protein